MNVSKQRLNMIVTLSRPGPGLKNADIIHHSDILTV